MEAEALGYVGIAVYRVTADGCVEAPGMGGMDAELVCAACQRMKLNQGPVWFATQDTETGHGLFAVLKIHNLTRPVQRVWT